MSEPILAGSHQLGFDLGDNSSNQSFEPDPDDVRQELEFVLAAARGVTAECPWDQRTFQYHRVVFPQMARWLPDDEAAQLCLEFAREIERIEQLLAA